MALRRQTPGAQYDKSKIARRGFADILRQYYESLFCMFWLEALCVHLTHERG